MSGACLLVGTLALQLASGNFQLSWQHSVERTEWRETWRVADGTLHLIEASVKGSGAGMDPGAGAVLQDGWWVWQPDLPPVTQLNLAASGATGSGWRICSDGVCRDIGQTAGDPIRIAVCGE